MTDEQRDRYEVVRRSRLQPKEMQKVCSRILPRSAISLPFCLHVRGTFVLPSSSRALQPNMARKHHPRITLCKHAVALFHHYSIRSQHTG